jgi:hypothetical protein
LANFLSISPNQTKFLPSVCLVPGLEFSAIPVLISAVSLEMLSNYIHDSNIAYYYYTTSLLKNIFDNSFLKT